MPVSRLDEITHVTNVIQKKVGGLGHDGKHQSQLF
jgi:hypothetical protein